MEVLTELLFILAIAMFVVSVVYSRKPFLQYASVLLCLGALIAVIMDTTLGVDGSYDRVLMVVLSAGLALLSIGRGLVPGDAKV